MTRTSSGRRTKGQIVERVVHYKTKREGVVRLDKTGMVFWAIAGTESTSPYFESKDGGEVKRWLDAQLGRTTEADRLTWIPVVAVKVDEEHHRYGDDDPDDRNESISVDIERYWLALTHDKREWRKLDWPQADPESGTTIDENDRASQSKFYRKGSGHEDFKPGAKLRYGYGDDAKPFILPHHERGGKSIVHYTPELWFGLVAIVEQIATMRKKIAETLGTKKGLAMIAAAMPLRITATSGAEEPPK